MDSGKKYGWIVSLRAFAAMAIVLLHVISGWSVEISWGGGSRPSLVPGWRNHSGVGTLGCPCLCYDFRLPAFEPG